MLLRIFLFSFPPPSFSPMRNSSPHSSVPQLFPSGCFLLPLPEPRPDGFFPPPRMRQYKKFSTLPTLSLYNSAVPKRRQVIVCGPFFSPLFLPVQDALTDAEAFPSLHLQLSLLPTGDEIIFDSPPPFSFFPSFFSSRHTQGRRVRA